MQATNGLKLHNKKEVNMLSGSIMKGVLTIAIPIMIMNVLQSVFNIIDGAIRISFTYQNTKEQADYAARVICAEVKKLYGRRKGRK